MSESLDWSEQLTENLLALGLLEATSSFEILVINDGNVLPTISLGESYKFFDIASLTKVVFTTTALMKAVDSGLLDVNSNLKKYLPEFSDSNITISRLLTHSAGHVWWKAFYKELFDPSMDASPGDWQEQWKRFKRILLEEEREENPQKFIYSDVDFFFLKFVLEEVWQKDLLEIFEELKENLKLENMHFSVNNQAKFSDSIYAPTENSQFLSKLIKAQVHDENCFSLGGVSTHAGLFSDMSSMKNWASWIRDTYYNGSDYLSKEVLIDFASRKTSTEYGDWAYGFMKPSPGKSSCGKYFSDESFGHTGFTGTSFWFDPKLDLAVVILSNRVHPTRENKKFVGLRGPIHDLVVESLGKDS